jgi:hypothetical protein
MATNKAKRSIHLAQPQPKLGNLNPSRRPDHEPAGLMPVKAHIYHAMAELNAGLEKAIVNLKVLQNIHFFRSCGLTAMNDVLCGIRARANRQLMTVANERETVNTGHFQQFSVEPKNR